VSKFLLNLLVQNLKVLVNSEIYLNPKILFSYSLLAFGPAGLTGPLGLFCPASPAGFFLPHRSRARKPLPVACLTPPPWPPSTTSIEGKKSPRHLLLHSPIKRYTPSPFPLFICPITGGIESILHRQPLKAPRHFRLPPDPIKERPHSSRAPHLLTSPPPILSCTLVVAAWSRSPTAGAPPPHRHPSSGERSPVTPPHPLRVATLAASHRGPERPLGRAPVSHP
jgi:hypothetical protein